jgi:hypothetical protein
MYRQNYGLGSLVSTIVKNNSNLFNPVSAFPTQYGGTAPLMSGMSTPQTTRYGRKYGLSLPMVDYLNAPLPDISGLFAPLAGTAPVVDVPIEDVTEDQILQAIAAQDYYNQINQGGGEGMGDDGGQIGDGSNLGIDFGFTDVLGIAALGPGYLAGKIGKSIYDNIRNPYTNPLGMLNKDTKEAIEKDNLKDLQDRVDKGLVDFSFGITPEQDKYRGRQDDVVDNIVDEVALTGDADGPSGPSGTSTSGSFGTRGPGMQGYGGGADMGSGPSGDPGPASGPGGGYADQATGSDTSPGATGGEGGFGPGNNDANTGDDTSPGATGGEGGSGDGCFLKGTLVTMLDGSKKEIQEIDLGDEVAKGGKVFATGKFLVNNLYDYKGIKVSGSHMVFEEGNWTRVEDSKYGKALGDEEHTVYVFGCENRRILIEDILFTDYFEVKDQDKLIEDKEKFFDNWKTFANNEDRKNVNTLNAN